MSPATWEHAEGNIPFKVVAFENADRKGVVYLRWRAKGNWRYQSLRFTLRTAEGRIIKAREREAVEAARAKHRTLVSGVPVSDRPKPALTVGQTVDLLTAPDRGLYPDNTPHRREVQRSLALAVAVWGTDTPWLALTPARMRELWLARLRAVRGKGKGFAGRRSAEIVMRDVRAIAVKLFEEGLVPPEVLVALKRTKKSREEILTATPDAKVARPRHTLEEAQRILAVAWDVDPRFGLLLSLGAELRLGQVARARRSDLSLDTGRFTSPGRGKKRGEVVNLTTGQRAAAERALNGYLREVEGALPDYRLFPSGQLKGGRSGQGVVKVEQAEATPVSGSTIGAWFRDAEQRAGVPHQPGRGYYGIRRGAVDGAKGAGISREGLQKLGGWADSQMPDRIYADQEAEYARQEASEVRAKIRGENG